MSNEHEHREAPEARGDGVPAEDGSVATLRDSADEAPAAEVAQEPTSDPAQPAPAGAEDGDPDGHAVASSADDDRVDGQGSGAATEDDLTDELGASEELAEDPGSREDAEPAEEVPPLDDEAAGALGQALFALLFASPDPLSLGRLRDLTDSPTLHVRQGLAALEGLVDQSGLPLVLRAIAGGYRLFSAPEVAEVVARLAKVRKAEQVTPAALETLSIVAYRQPVTKAEVEAIRGVQAGPMLRQLIDRGLVKVAGRADQPGSPLLYATTREFLDRFGLARLKDLPRDAELK